jgi:ABC-type polysaccharide/polyol phosphate transport system ATPase subunit
VLLMPAEPAIVFDRVSKMYHKRAGTGTLLSMIPGLRPRASDEFWALRDVSFEVRHGECLGIIGPNGAGKSTVLKILSKITSPTSGSFRVAGRLSSLIEVGAGFHPELTGRENVYLNAAILGMSRREIEAKFDEIVDFAELWDFIDVPVKRYSSGMYVRLGFSVAAHTEPEVLLVDEVLAGGDERFRNRCMARIEELRERDVAICYVSHSLHRVQRFCDRALFLDRGRMQAVGEPEEVCGRYLLEQGSASGTYGAIRLSPDDFDLERVELRGHPGGRPATVTLGDDLVLDFAFEVKAPVRQPVVAFVLYSTGGGFLGTCDTEFDGLDLSQACPGRLAGSLRIVRPSLATGGFALLLVVRDGERYLHRAPVAEFTMAGTGDKMGVIHLDHEWNFGELAAEGATA